MLRFLISIAAGILLLTQLVLCQNASEQLRSSKCWEFSRPGYEIAAASAISDGVLVSNSAGSLILLAKNGQQLWQSEGLGTLRSNIAANGRSVYMVSQVSTKNGDAVVLRGLSLHTGLPILTLDVGGEGSKWRLLLFGNRIVASESNGRLLAIDVDARSRVWERPGGDPSINAEFADQDTIGLATGAGDLLLVSVFNGKERGRVDLLHGISAFYLSGDHTYLGNATGEIAAAQTAGSAAKWKFRTGGRITHILEAARSIFVGSNDNFLYSFEPTRGALQWKRRLSGRIAGVVPVLGTYLAVNALDAKDWDLIDARNGRNAGRIVSDGVDATRSSAFAFLNGMVISAPNAVSFYSFENCPE